jgi:hypothetical protein
MQEPIKQFVLADQAADELDDWGLVMHELPVTDITNDSYWSDVEEGCHSLLSFN